MKDATVHFLLFIEFDDVSIHASREGRDPDSRPLRPLPPVSIHASREGRDECGGDIGDRGRRVSIHASREGRDASLADT